MNMSKNMTNKSIKLKLNQNGFTLIEFMIATAVFVSVIAAGSGFFSNLNRSAIVNEEMVDMQQDIRMAMVTLVRDISMAGYGINPSFGACGTGLTPTNSNTGPDAIAVASMSNVAGTLGVAALTGATQLTILASPPAVVPPLGQISIDGIKTVNAVLSAGNVVNITPVLTGAAGGVGENYAIGTQILTPSCIQYTVDTAARTLNRNVDGVVSLLANGVLDMQFAYALDANDDNLIDDTDGNGTFSAGDFVSVPATLGDIRLVRVSLFIQSARNNTNYVLGAPLPLEDHDPTTDVGYDIINYSPFRSRVLTRIVRPRNIGLP